LPRLLERHQKIKLPIISAARPTQLVAAPFAITLVVLSCFANSPGCEQSEKPGFAL